MLQPLQGKKILVMGLGVHGGGSGVARWLAQQGAQVTVTDLKQKSDLRPAVLELRGLPITYVLGRHRQSDFRSADLIIKNPDVPDASPYLKIARAHHVPVETDIALFWLSCVAPIIGITGSKGKSTTVVLLGEMFRAAKKRPVVAGNISASPFTFLKKITAQTPVILELSSWQLAGLERHRLSPHLSVLTNLYPEHLNRYRSYAHYIKDKELIFQFQTIGDVAVLNRDNADSRRLAAAVPSQRFWFSKKYFAEENGAFCRAGWLMFRYNDIEEKIIRADALRVIGQHNLENVLAAIVVARVSRLPLSAVRTVLRRFTGVPSRTELIRVFRGVKYYNDSKATAPVATISALKTLASGKNIILLVGGADKKSDFGELAKLIKRTVRQVVLFDGAASPKIKRALTALGYGAIIPAHSMTGAVRVAATLAVPGDIVLLSPACASFGLFAHAEDRARQFQIQVSKLK
ncbi:UDP-N-acetylmuramoyl-L-alanine--D-glutamate ligase [Candidatus Falkowbacteria bacterium]|nr:UDP-N-acetylmuramoyl-L-alanine--D-glutamate ligase [Candidatus Falkowbacteria bacterium]